MKVKHLLYVLVPYAIIIINCNVLARERRHPAVDMLPIYEIYKEADATLYCISDGYPKPQIRWTYTPCYNYTCDYNQTKSYSSSYIHSITVTSDGHKLRLRPTEEGVVKCEATNVIGTNTTTGLILFRDMNYGDSFFLKKKNGGAKPIFPGDEVEITCVAVNSNFDIGLDWYLNNEPFNVDRIRKVNIHSNKGLEHQSKLYWWAIESSDAGTYECRKYFKNHNLSMSMYYDVLVKDGDPLWMVLLKYLFGFVLPGTFSLFSIYAWCFLSKRTERKILEKLKASFAEGNPDEIKPDVLLNDQGDLLPYDQKFEFPRDKLIMGKQLGAGAFGIVMKATAYGITSNEEQTIVAVKMIRNNTDHKSVRSLMSELKILIYLGKHLNVVNLLGAVTDNLNNLELMVIVEYCQYGNVQNILRIHRRQFVDQINRESDTIDPNISSRIAQNEPITPNPTSIEVDGSESAQNNYTNVPRGLLSISTSDLVSWSFQVASGMQYLTSRNVLHGDLAARNILLCENNVVKICDFGLSRSMQHDPNYRKLSDTPLPFKWLAIEALCERVFNTATDVWSFGIFMWELFSLGEAPYPGMDADEQLVIRIRDGYRMAKPAFATREIYDIMLSCWYLSPETRPSFAALEKRLGQFLGPKLSGYYVELSKPYLQVNTGRLGNERTSYVTSIPSPTNLAPPLPPPVVLAAYVNVRGPADGSSSTRPDDMVEIDLNGQMNARAYSA